MDNTLLDDEEETGWELAVKGMARVSSGREGVIEAGLALANRIVTLKGEVCGDDIMESLNIPDDVDPRIVGPILMKLRKQKGLVTLRQQPSRRPSQHHNLIAVAGFRSSPPRHCDTCTCAALDR